MELIIFFISIFILSSINLSTQYLSNYKNLEFKKNEHLGSSYIWKNHSKFAGLTIFFGDSVIKGFFPVFLSKYILNINNEYIFLYILIIQMIGNNWSIFLKFKGGRGMAIAIGSLLGINFVLALILYGTYILLYFGKFKDGGITWIISLAIVAIISISFSLNVLYCYLACIFLTILKRVSGNEFKFDINVILNRIIYDRDFKKRKNNCEQMDCGNKVNTNLKCGDSDCQNFICPKCMVHTKTVPKCKKCAKLKKNPAFNPSPKELILSFTVCSTASISISIGINATLNIINNVAPGIIVFYLLLLVPPLLGWAIGNIIERTSRYKKSLTLTLISGLSSAAGHLIISFGFQVDFFYWLISLAITIYLSINKVKV